MYTKNNIHRLSSQYKYLENEKLESYKWYVAFVGNMQHVRKISGSLKEIPELNYHIWAPCYKEYRKYRSDFILADRLLYSGYIFIGLTDPHKFCEVELKLKQSRLGYLLGASQNFLKKQDLENVYSMYLKFQDCKKMMFNVQAGDSVTLRSGPFSGLCGTVQHVYPDGRVRLKAYFMQRELEMNISVMDLQVLNVGNFYDESEFFTNN